MSARSRIAVAAALAVAIGAGFAFGRATAPERSPAEIRREVRSELAEFERNLDRLPAAYERGGRANAEPLLTRIAEVLRALSGDLRGLDPMGADRLEYGVRMLRAEIERDAPARNVAHTADELEASLDGIRVGR